MRWNEESDGGGKKRGMERREIEEMWINKRDWRRTRMCQDVDCCAVQCSAVQDKTAVHYSKH